MQVDSDFDLLSRSDLVSCIDNLFARLIELLHQASMVTIPVVKRNFLKHWWSNELSVLKDDCIAAHRDWVAYGKPRSGEVFARRQSTRAAYRHKVRAAKRSKDSAFSAKLQDLLVSKDRPSDFWKTWRAKVNKSTTQVSVNGSCDPAVIASDFARFFSEIGNAAITEQEKSLSDRARALHEAGDVSLSDELYNFDLVCSLDITVVSDAIKQMVMRKAPGPDGISSEHIIYSHPIVASILLRLYKWILLTGHVPDCFTSSYMVPLPKNKDKTSCVLVCEDFRGISISSVLSKLFESCVLAICGDLFETTGYQFGFKRGLGCSHAVHVAQEYIDAYNRGGDTAHIAALDVAKAFPRVNHDAVVIKLYERNFPIPIIQLISDWFVRSSFSVKWQACVSDAFTLRTGVNQGSVLAPFIFALLIDDVIRKCTTWRRYDQGIILVYADDIILITRTRRNLQELLLCVQADLTEISLQLNTNKCCFMRIGPHYNEHCAPIVTSQGMNIPTVSEMRYLGVYFVCHRTLRPSMDRAKRSFSKATNAILSHLQGRASEEVIFHLVRTKALPILLYATEAINLSTTTIRSLDFCVVRFVMKIIRTGNSKIAQDCMNFFGFSLPSVLIAARKRKFLSCFNANITNNSVCAIAACLRL
jgi:hypothetical protein